MNPTAQGTKTLKTAARGLWDMELPGLSHAGMTPSSCSPARWGANRPVPYDHAGQRLLWPGSPHAWARLSWASYQHGGYNNMLSSALFSPVHTVQEMESSPASSQGLH